MKPLLAASTFFVLALTLCAGSFAQAHSLQAIKGTKALLTLDESPAAIGDVFQVTDASGAEAAQIQIRQIKEKRAVAYILKGELPQAPESYQLLPMAKSEDTPAVPLPSPTPVATKTTTPAPQAKGYYGGISYNQMKVSLTSSTTLNLSGTSFNFGAFYERAMSPRVQVLAHAGYEGLAAKGSLNSNACGASCDVAISYLNADAIVKYSFYQNKKTWWVGGGLGFLLPVLKSSNVLDADKLTISEKIILAGGLNWYRNPKTFIPLQLEYALQPSNNVVSTSQIIVRAGYGIVF